MSGERLTWRGEALGTLAEGVRGWARGYAFPPGGPGLEDAEIARYLASRHADLEAAVAGLNGCFAAVLDAPPAPVLVSDRYGTVPLYLHRRPGGGVVAAPDPWSVAAALEATPALDVAGALDLLRTGYVLGTRTLLEGVETLGPATLARVERGGLHTRRYWTYGYRPTPLDPGEAEEALAGILGRVGRRTARLLEERGHRPALTLSGGLDSRVLAAVIAPAFPGPVSALTYGAAGNPEVEVAREVAGALGMAFRASDVSSEYLNDAFVARSVREVGATTRFTCGLGARHVDASGLDVLIPGHTGDFVSGGHLPVQVGMVRTRRQLQHYLEFAHFRYLGSEPLLRRVLRIDYDAWRWRTLQESTEGFDTGSEDVFGLVDRWNVENRQRRLILMELRAYESRGRWMLPFYDHELVDFFATLPHALRVGQNLYVETARRRLFTGAAAALAELRRVGGRPLHSDPELYRRIERLQGLQPLSGWFLELGLAPFRDLLRRLRPRPEQAHGTDTWKAWLRDDARARAFLLDRVAALDVDWIDAEALLAELRAGRGEERVYNRLLPGVLTIGECLDQARAAWRGSRGG